MCNIHENETAVHSEPPDMPFAQWIETAEARGDDGDWRDFAPNPHADAWCAEHEAEPKRDDPTDLTDRAWLFDEACHFKALSDPAELDLSGFIAGAFLSLVTSMNFHRIDSAAALAKVRRIDLDAVQVGGGFGSRGSALAAALHFQVSWYLQIDRPAATLAAHALAAHAALAERMGSQCVEDWQIDEAAWRAAAIDAVCEVACVC